MDKLPRCDEPIILTDAEIARLEGVPAPAHIVDEVLPCDLQASHRVARVGRQATQRQRSGRRPRVERQVCPRTGACEWISRPAVYLDHESMTEALADSRATAVATLTGGPGATAAN